MSNQDINTLTAAILDNIRVAKLNLAPTGYCFCAEEVYKRLNRVHQLHLLFEQPAPNWEQNQTIGQHSLEVAGCAHRIFFYGYDQEDDARQRLLDLWQPWLVLAGLFHDLTKGLLIEDPQLQRLDKHSNGLTAVLTDQILYESGVELFHRQIVLVLIDMMETFKFVNDECSLKDAVNLYRGKFAHLKELADAGEAAMLNIGVFLEATIALWLANGRYDLVTAKPQEPWQEKLDSLRKTLARES